MVHRSEDATALLGMAGFVVGVQELIDGEWWLYVETTADRAACPECGYWASGHGRRRVAIRDLTISGAPVVLLWAKRIWRCCDPDCDKGTWTETNDAVRPKAALSERAGIEICRRVGEDGDSVAEVARVYGVGWHTAMACVARHGRPLVDDAARIAATEALGTDETVFLHARRNRHSAYATGMVDLDRSQLLDVVLGRSGPVLGDWLDAQPPRWRDQIAVAAIDPFRGYANALGSRLPGATLVVDHFHAVRLANAAIDDIRRRVQQDTTGHRGRTGDPLYGIRRLLLVGSERLSERGWERIHAGLAAGDPADELAAAVAAKELLRDVYSAPGIQAARARLVVFYAYCADAEVPELIRLATTVSEWAEEILAYHASGRASNGPTEAVNLGIETVRRTGHGFRNFNNYRLRLLLALGVKWHTQPTAQIRSRHPRLIA
ncbi:MAG: ISL3 family transposase [Acidimicrobiales bacterium]